MLFVLRNDPCDLKFEPYKYYIKSLRIPIMLMYVCENSHLKTPLSGDAAFSVSADFSDDYVPFSVEDRSCDAHIFRFCVPTSARRASSSYLSAIVGQNFKSGSCRVWSAEGFRTRCISTVLIFSIIRCIFGFFLFTKASRRPNPAGTSRPILRAKVQRQIFVVFTWKKRKQNLLYRKLPSDSLSTAWHS